MKILFSPSESKIRPLKIKDTQNCIKSLCSDILQDNIISYQKALQSADEGIIKKIFGTKKIDMDELQDSIQLDRFSPAILLYSGVAYKALEYTRLDSSAQGFVDKNVLIFSNLYGVLAPQDIIAFYNLHQNAGFGGFALKAIYNKIQNKLDEMLEDKIVLDLRASIYKKVAKIQTPKELIEVEFIKNGKVLSHYAKLYRGLYLRYLATSSTKPKDFKELCEIKFDGLNLIKKEHMSLTYEINIT